MLSPLNSRTTLQRRVSVPPEVLFMPDSRHSDDEDVFFDDVTRISGRRQYRSPTPSSPLDLPEDSTVTVDRRYASYADDGEQEEGKRQGSQVHQIMEERYGPPRTPIGTPIPPVVSSTPHRAQVDRPRVEFSTATVTYNPDAEGIVLTSYTPHLPVHPASSDMNGMRSEEVRGEPSVDDEAEEKQMAERLTLERAYARATTRRLVAVAVTGIAGGFAGVAALILLVQGL